MLLTLRGKEFEIEFVSNYVHELYSKMRDLSFRQAGIVGEIQDSAKSKDIEDVQRLTGEVARNNAEILRLRQEILKELIESNDLEYDESWWLRRTGPEDVNDFIVTCLNKDVSLDGSRVKKK